VEVRLRDGRVLAEDGTFPRGHPRNPATWGDIVSKFEMLTAHALDAKARAQITGIVEDIDDLDDINTLQRVVAQAAANR